MLMAHPAVLLELIEEYEVLELLHARQGRDEVRRRMDDVAYTLCVSTGTRDVDAALLAARQQLPRTSVKHDSLLAG
ncbi:DUF5133 domain-containing protein [Streptomyces decoyicus]|uniref:DUF5133 domain-containing protein n=1 Tax=Streptomyces decoyicus TaxID=249567 RepID=UPI0004AA2BC2|nr:DUF5133 domain-containing protein [Streptomyces decoyicus]KOG37905.1 hypothetical protein ADK74_34830 [Streptomyces decoyicus]QZY18630.1 DUF5133 domain-containing protein [Streptomyces decoyicus]